MAGDDVSRAWTEHRHAPEGGWATTSAEAGGPTAIGRIIRQVRERKALSQHELALRLRDVAASDGEHPQTTRRTISRWERDSRIPQPAYRRWLAVALDLPLERLNRAAAVRSEDSASGHLDAMGVGGTGSRASTLDRPRRITLAHVEAAKELTQTFRHQDNRFGGGYARGVAAHYLEFTVIPLLRHGRYDQDVGQALFGIAAQLAHLVAWMAYDMEDHSGAQHYMAKALALTTASDDDAFGGEILAGMSHHAIHLRHAAETLDLARASQHIAAKIHLTALLAEAHVMEAHGHALLGDSKSCATSLHAAEVAFDQSQLTGLPEWLQYLDEGYLAARFAHCFRDLRDWHQAEQFALRAVRMSDNLARTRSFNTALLATTYVENDLEEACRVGLEAVELASRLQSGRTVLYIRDLARRLHKRHTGDPIVGRFTEQVSDVLGAAAWD